MKWATFLAAGIWLLIGLQCALADTTFYEAYEAGMDAENRQQWKEAREYFLQAAALNPTPGRRVRTGRLKPIQLYDPYAHLAVCEAKLGLLDEAKAHLEQSWKANVTPRFVLNEMKKRLEKAYREREKQKEEIPPPVTAAPPEKKKTSAKEKVVQTAPKQELPAPPPLSTFVKPPQETVAKPADQAKSDVAPQNRIRNPNVLLGALLVLLLVVILIYKQKRPGEPPPIQPALEAANETPTEWIPETVETLAEVRKGSPKAPTVANPLPEGVSPEFGGYRLEGVLGRGGMGTTYLAVRNRDQLSMALKIPHDHLLDDREFEQRFVRESELGSTLHHPNIIRIYETGRVGSRLFIAMELLEGETLESRIRKCGKFPLHEALETARDIAVALDYARLKGIVHRDLKPDNIMLLERGGLKVMDFGIARILDSPGLTASAAYLGTPSYSAPEATTGSQQVDHRADLYSLGIILFRLLSGELPYHSQNSLEVLIMHRNNPLPKFAAELQIPNDVIHMVEILTAKTKTERYQDAEKFLIELNRILNPQL